MTTDNPLVRTATEADAACLYELTNLFTPGLETSFEEFEGHLCALLQDPSWFVAVAIGHNALSGYVAVQDYGRALRGSFSVGRIHDLFVTPSARRSGTGRSLVELAFVWAKERPIPMILDWQATPEAVSFYESLGFKADFVGDFPECPGFTLDLRQGSAR